MINLADAERAIAARRAISTSFRTGLHGVSAKRTRVLSVTAAFTSSGSDMSASVTVTPFAWSIPRANSAVPAYEMSEMIK